MTQTNAAAPRKHKVLKVLGWGFGIILVLLIVLYFVATSAGFFKGVILPRAGASLNSKITVSDASISPFKQVVLKDFQLQPNGAETLVKAGEVRARYSLMDIIGGNLNIEEVTISQPTITLVTKPDGSSNLDPLMKAMEEGEKSPDKSPSSEEPVKLNLKQLAIRDGTVRMVTQYAGGKQDVMELSKADMTLENLRNGATGKLTMSSVLLMENNPPAPDTNGVLRGSLSGQFDLALDAALAPASIRGNSRFEVTQAQGGMAALAGFNSTLQTDISATEIKEAVVRFQKGNVSLGELRASGPFNLSKVEGRLAVSLQGVNKQMLNLAVADMGMDFGPTTVVSTNVLDISGGGLLVKAAGQFDIVNLQITQTNQTTPSMDIHTHYDLLIDASNSVALLRELTTTATQERQEIAKGALSSPMQISWGTTSNMVADSIFQLAVNGFDLGKWQAFTGGSVPQGLVQANLKVTSQGAGKFLLFNADAQISQLALIVASNRVSDLGISFSTSAKATDLAQYDVADLKFGMSQAGQEALSASGKGSYNMTNGAAAFDVQGSAALPTVLKLAGMPDLAATSGTATFQTKIEQKNEQQQITGKAGLNDFTGNFGSNVFQAFGMQADFDLVMDTNLVNIRKLSGSLSGSKQPGGSFQVGGTYAFANGAANLKVALQGLNQNGLRPFLEPMLTGKQLVSVGLNGTSDVQFNPSADSVIKGALQLTNLVVKDVKTAQTSSPLAVSMQMDVGMKNSVTEIRQVSAALTPTERATNVVQLQGKIDMSNTNFVQGNLSITADSLDLTQYYDLFMGETAETASTSGTVQSTPAQASTEPEKEAEPMQLPVRNFTADLKVGRLYLHELEATNIVAGLKLDGGKITASPLSMMLNGSPAKANIDLDLGVPGWKYALNFSAVEVPFAPLVNTFVPERKGEVQGTITAVGDLSGKGTTWANMQKNLAGSFDIGTTNLNLALSNIRSPLLRATINIVAILPDIIKGGGSGSALSSLAGAVLGSRSGATAPTGEWSDELSKSPVQIIQGRGKIASSKMELEQALVQSPAFQVITHGTVVLAPVRTNSTIDFPLTVGLTRDLAEKINMVPANTPTNAVFVAMPEYVSLKGTLGEPKKQINAKAIAGTALKQLGGSVGDKKTGNLLQNLGGALSGQKSTDTNAPASTNQPSVGGLLQGLLGGQKSGDTNSPTTTTNRPRGGLLNQLLGPGTK
jgi:hypothetical protein